MRRRIPVAVLRDGGLAALLVIGPDCRLIGDGRDFARLSAGRSGDGIILSRDGLPVMTAEKGAELDLRTAEKIRIGLVTAAGVRLLETEVRISWKNGSAIPRQGKKSA